MSLPRRFRALFAGLVCLSVGAAGIGCTQPPPPPPPASPNVLFLLTDDLSLDEIAVMPNLKRLLLDQGVSFSNYFVSVSLCCPSRTTTLRGQYAHNTGIETNGGTNGGFAKVYSDGLERSTIATWLQASGYRTALIGKYLNGYPNGAEDTYVPPGWDEWASASRGGTPYNEFDYTLNENGKLVRYGNDPQDYGTDVYTGKAVKFINEAAVDKKPFFTYLSLYAPHQPATPAPRHADLFPNAKAPRSASYNEADVSDKPAWVRTKPLLGAAQQRSIDELYRKRLQSLQAVDESVAKLVGTLKANNQLDNTYFVFTSDNGFHLGQHRLTAGKQTAYEEDIRLPLVVRGPGIAPGRTQSQMIGNVDLAPTFADLAGAAAPDFVDGRSFAPFLKGHDTAGRQAYLLEHRPTTQTPAGAALDPSTQEPPDPDQTVRGGQAGRGGRGRQKRAARTGAARPAKAGGVVIPMYRGIRTTRYTYVEYATGERELYDLRSDPAELTNLAKTADRSLLAQLSQRVSGLKSCKAASCRTLEDQPIG